MERKLEQYCKGSKENINSNDNSELKTNCAIGKKANLKESNLEKTSFEIYS